MQLPHIKPGARIERIEWARLQGERPRSAGCNARLGEHGKEIYVDLARITAEGMTAFGWSRISRERAETMLGTALGDVFDPNGLVLPSYRELEFPLLDWVGRVAKKPVYALVAGADPSGGRDFTVRCYDTSLYFDDLDLKEDADAVRRIQDEALEGWERGHRAFKIKVGRGGMHMPVREGTDRDIAVVRGVREAVGPNNPIMLDANNGYNLNLTKEVLDATKDVEVFWMEEAFHEDPVLYGNLKEWLKEREISVLIADGEGDASPALLTHAGRGLIDVVQYDLRMYGFNRWLELVRSLDAEGIHSAPHNYGGLYGNYAQCHIAAGIENFLFAEWDEAQAPALDASGYSIVDGRVNVPNLPGFGLELDDRHFTEQVKLNGWSVDL